MALGTFTAYTRYFPADIIPLSSDEIDYWLQSKAFFHAGFSMGYFTLNELTPPFAASPFSCHGPAFPIISGMLARLLGGFPAWAALPFNAIYLLVCLSLFLWLIRPTRGYLWGVLALLPGLSYLYVHMPLFMQEVLHHGIAFVLAGMFFRVLTAKRRAPWIAALFLLLVAVGILRVSWTIFFIPLAMMAARPSWLGRFLGAVVGVACMAGTYMAWMATAAPYPYGLGRKFLLEGATGQISPLVVLAHFWNLFAGNVANLWATELAQGNGILWIFLVWMILFPLFLYRSRPASASGESLSPRARGDLFWLHAVGLGGLLLMQLIYVEVIAKILITHLVVSFLLGMRLVRAPVLAAGVLSALLAVLPVYFVQVRYPSDVGILTDPFRQERLSSFQAFVAPLLAYQPSSNRWCNTILIGDIEYPCELLGLPGGLGVSFISDFRTFAPPARSRYLVLRNDRQVANFSASNHILLLAHSPIGDIYLNEDCHCP